MRAYIAACWLVVFAGSASNAQNADSLAISSPEVDSYVRVCDAFGTGYFYIPGTETCLKIGGHVRHEIRFGGKTGAIYGGFDNDGDLIGDRAHHRNRVSLQVSTAADTEYGPLKTITEVRFTTDNSDDKVPFLKYNVIEIGGFRLGKDDSAFSAFTGYAGAVIADDLIPYGLVDTNVVSYTYKHESGLSWMISLEDGNAGEYRSFNDPSHPLSVSLGSGFPHVVGGIKYAQSWGELAFVGVMENRTDTFVGKVRGTWKVTPALTLFAMAALSSDDDDGGEESGYSPWGGSWAAWLGSNWKITPSLSFNTQVSFDKFEELAVVLSLPYEVTKGLRFTPELQYKDFGRYPARGATAIQDELWSGMFRLQRTF